MMSSVLFVRNRERAVVPLPEGHDDIFMFFIETITPLGNGLGIRDIEHDSVVCISGENLHLQDVHDAWMSLPEDTRICFDVYISDTHDEDVVFRYVDTVFPGSPTYIDKQI